ncbi:GAF domain-containing protein [candidate division KSB1 bacterium]|nr:GAF domain-containing protein [candidate division KSB1 bacterium]
MNIIYSGKAHKKLFEKAISNVPQWTFYAIDDYKKLLLNDPSYSVLVFDTDNNEKDNVATKLFKDKKNGLAASLYILSAKEKPPENYDDLVDYMTVPSTPWQIVLVLKRLNTVLKSKKYIDVLEGKLSLQNQELYELNQIGIALSAERDPEKLLQLILQKAREVTSADAGSIYLVEKNESVGADENEYWRDKQLRFKLAHNDSVDASYNEFVMPVEKKSMAGYTALTGEPLNIRDAYSIPGDSEFQHNSSFDKKMGYHTKSVLCIPMKSHQGEIIGVLQLINRKKNWNVKLINEPVIRNQVINFNQRCVDLASSLASQAAVSIENMRLYEEIKRLFEGFIVASVHAIEQRDPTTSGHSERVAALTVGLAEKVDHLDTGIYQRIKFSRDDIQQIKYAALLHDFGKIGVRERVLVKAKKLYPEQLTTIEFRFQYLKQALKLAYIQEKIKILENNGKTHTGFDILDKEYNLKLQELDQYLAFILEANEPKILAEGGVEKLSEIREKTRFHGTIDQPLLTEQEIHFLSIPRGSLSQNERQEIESHVTHTFNFLSRIPWASHLKAVPQIAYAHHEKLDGSGYPRGLQSQDIPLPAKMMTIADIYDALTASDRPYKKAVPKEKALSILEFDVKNGKIDPVLFELFVVGNVYNIVHGQR